jgi:hypothetical protein
MALLGLWQLLSHPRIIPAPAMHPCVAKYPGICHSYRDHPRPATTATLWQGIPVTGIIPGLPLQPPMAPLWQGIPVTGIIPGLPLQPPYGKVSQLPGSSQVCHYSHPVARYPSYRDHPRSATTATLWQGIPVTGIIPGLPLQPPMAPLWQGIPYSILYQSCGFIYQEMLAPAL